MNVLVWNVRGLTDESKRILSEHCLSFSPLLVGIIEPKSKFHKIPQGYWRSLNLSPCHQNCRTPRRSNIWFFAQPSVVTNTVFSSDQVIVSECCWQNTRFRVAIVHGANDHTLRRKLWYDLLHFTDGSTLFIGDFNAVKGAHEHLSSVMPSRTSCSEFCRFIDDTGFLEPPSTGLQFSWSGRRFLPSHVESLLDRALVSPSFDQSWNAINTHVLPRITSDHSPIILQCSPHVARGRRAFRFLNMWTDHPGFMEVVGNSWAEQISTPCPILRVMLKLKRLKRVLKDWNYSVFGNIDTQLATYNQDLAAIQDQISREGYNDDNFLEEISKQAAINTLLTRKNTHLQQQSRLTWLKDGDRNTAFFHRMLRHRKTGLLINHLMIDGVAEYNQVAIEQHIVEHFSNLFSQGGLNNVNMLELEANIDPHITDEQNLELIAIPTDLEIAATVSGMEA
ncbi:uncharacterized protein LOC131008195 [Salvia miltiorrhiza]|uniref:uncharacterized protein LOC131008195 n=1 Tax=Salvia miltiorrhiza TaxID=226208 RepID=UPI0025AB8569|nr:uncharacterized protein LOC131008195 [Salvia miltiorrhiza]